MKNSGKVKKKLRDKNPDYQSKGLNSNGEVLSDNLSACSSTANVITVRY